MNHCDDDDDVDNSNDERRIHRQHVTSDDNHDLSTEEQSSKKKANDYKNTKKLSLDGLGSSQMEFLPHHAVSRDAMNEYLLENMCPQVTLNENCSSNSLDRVGKLFHTANLIHPDNSLSSSDEENQVLVWQEDRLDSDTSGVVGAEVCNGGSHHHHDTATMAVGLVNGFKLSNQASDDFIDIDMLPQSYMAHSDWDDEDMDRASTDSQNDEGMVAAPDPGANGDRVHGDFLQNQLERLPVNDFWNNLNQRISTVNDSNDNSFVNGNSSNALTNSDLGDIVTNSYSSFLLPSYQTDRQALDSLPLFRDPPSRHDMSVPPDWNLAGQLANMNDQSDDADSESSDVPLSRQLDSNLVSGSVSARHHQQSSSNSSGPVNNIDELPGTNDNRRSCPLRDLNHRHTLLGLNGLVPSASTGHLLDLSAPTSNSLSQQSLIKTRNTSSNDCSHPATSATKIRGASSVNDLTKGSPSKEKSATSMRLQTSPSSAMLWTDLEASLSQRAQRLPSSYGAVAVINVLRALKLSQHCSMQALSEALSQRPQAPLPSTANYLLNRSRAGIPGGELVAGVNRCLPGVLQGRFFPTDRDTSPRKLVSWLAAWMRRGAVPVLSLNLQCGIPALYVVPDDAWQHQMVYRVGDDVCFALPWSYQAGVYMTNPIQSVPEHVVHQQLSSEGILLVRKSDIIETWTPDSDLTLLCSQEDNRWSQMNVLGQVVCAIRETHQENFPGFLPEWAHHVTIPSIHLPGISLFASPASQPQLCQDIASHPGFSSNLTSRPPGCHGDEPSGGPPVDNL